MNKQWIVIITSKQGHVGIAAVKGPRVAEQFEIFHSEDAAENFAAACRDSIDNLYTAQVVSVEYCDPENVV